MARLFDATQGPKRKEKFGHAEENDVQPKVALKQRVNTRKLAESKIDKVKSDKDRAEKEGGKKTNKKVTKPKPSVPTVKNVVVNLPGARTKTVPSETHETLPNQADVAADATQDKKPKASGRKPSSEKSSEKFSRNDQAPRGQMKEQDGKEKQRRDEAALHTQQAIERASHGFAALQFIGDDAEVDVTKLMDSTRSPSKKNTSKFTGAEGVVLLDDIPVPSGENVDDGEFQKVKSKQQLAEEKRQQKVQEEKQRAVAVTCLLACFCAHVVRSGNAWRNHSARKKKVSERHWRLPKKTG